MLVSLKKDPQNLQWPSILQIWGDLKRSVIYQINSFQNMNSHKFWILANFWDFEIDASVKNLPIYTLQGHKKMSHWSY